MILRMQRIELRVFEVSKVHTQFYEENKRLPTTATRLLKNHDGTVIEYGLLSQDAKNTLAHSLRSSYRNISPTHPFGLVIIPTQALVNAIGQDTVASIIEWHRRGESKNGLIPDHGSSVWPILLSPWDEDGPELIEDGWHRLCSYIVGGLAHVPALLDLQPDEYE